MQKKKKNMTCFILVQGFCPLKIKITQFPDGFCLNILTSLQKLGFQMDYETRIYTLTPEINKTNKPLSNKSNNKIFKYLLNNTLCSLPENLTCLKITKYYEKKWNWMPSFANQLETLHTTTSYHCYRFRAANNSRSLDTGQPKLCLTKSNLSLDIMSRQFFYHKSFYGKEELKST